MKIKSQFFRSTKILRQQEHANFYLLFFSKAEQSVCKCVPHTLKLKLHIVPNMCITSKYLTQEMDETVWNGMAHSTPPNLTANILFPEIQTTRI